MGLQSVDFKFAMFLSTAYMDPFGVDKTPYFWLLVMHWVHPEHCFQGNCSSDAHEDYQHGGDKRIRYSKRPSSLHQTGAGIHALGLVDTLIRLIIQVR
jgi:hypothetical protein